MLQIARWATIAFALFSLALGAFELTGTMRPAVIGVSTEALPGSTFRVLSVNEGSAAERAGIQGGDVLAFVDPAEQSARHAAGDIVHLRRNGAVLAIPLAYVNLDGLTISQFVFAMFFPILALVIAFRAWDDPQARRLAVSFLWTVVLFADQYQTRWHALDGLLDVLDAALTPLGMSTLVAFCSGWAATPPRYAQIVRTIATAVAYIYGFAALASIVREQLASLSVPGTGLIGSIAWALLAFLAIASLCVSFGFSRGVERRRIGWILATFVVGIGPFAVYEPVHALVPSVLWPWVWYFQVVLPIGLGYATLRHRVIDLGFVLNRAAVFAATTLLLAGLFAALQWAVNGMLANATRREGFIAQLAIAVAVFYVVRVARAQTEAIVARVFFAARRRRIDAVAKIAHDLDDVDDAELLPMFVVDRLLSDAAIRATVYVRENKTLLRAAGEAAEPGAMPIAEAITGEEVYVPLAGAHARIDAIAFPLRVRSRLRGALICALPSDNEEFAPDERDALADLASHVAVARDDLLAEGLRRENRALRKRLAATVSARIR